MMKRKSLLKFLGTTLAICVVSGAAVGVNNALTAKALEYPTDAKFVMEEKASVRTADPAGIRFRVEMDETMRNYIVNNDDVTYGFLIFQQKDLGTITDDYHNAITTKVDITGDESKIYKAGESYWANGALTSIKTENFTKEFTCVAYTRVGTTYNYADLLDVEFSRSVYEVSSAAYINEPNQRGNLTTTYTELGTTKPILIDSYENLVALSTEVQNGEKFENVKFELGTNITLEDGYTAIPDTFAGTIDFGDYSVIAAQGKTISVNASIVNNAKYVEVVENTPYLMIVDSTNVKNYKAGTSSLSSLSVETQEILSTFSTGDTSYSGNAAKLSATSTSYSATLTLGWTKAQLQALKQSGYNSVVFDFMAYRSQNEGIKLYKTINNFTFVGQMGSWYFNRWYKLSVSIEDVAKAMNDENVLTLFSGMRKSGASPTLYFGDVTLSKETVTDPETFTLFKASEGNGEIMSKKSITESDGLYTKFGDNGQSSAYDESSNVQKLQMDTNSTAENCVVVQLAYSVEQLELLQEKGYNTLSVEVYATANETTGKVTFGEGGLFGAVKVNGVEVLNGISFGEGGSYPLNQKIELTVTIDKIIEQMKKVDQTSTQMINYLYLGQMKDRNKIPSICFGDFVLTKAE